MSFPSSRAALAALAIAIVGGLIGAGVYAGIGPSDTKTVVSGVTTVDQTQPVVASNALSINAIYQRAYKGEVDIKLTTSTNTGFGTQTGSAEGSGIVYDTKGDIITNEHVIAGGSAITVTFWNGKSYPAHVVGTDTASDLAVIKASAPSSEIFPLTFADSSKVQIGDGVVAIGSPYGLAGSVTSGIVSAVNRTINSPDNFSISAIQTDASINHGNSGGPLLNSLGQVIGVNAQIESDSGASDGVGFAIPSNTARSVASQLIAGLTVPHAFLGVRLEENAVVTGAVVKAAETGTPAANAGLKAGDVITELGGVPITSYDDLSAVINGHKPGDKVSLTYQRKGTSHTVTVKLTTRPA